MFALLVLVIAGGALRTSDAEQAIGGSEVSRGKEGKNTKMWWRRRARARWVRRKRRASDRGASARRASRSRMRGGRTRLARGRQARGARGRLGGDGTSGARPLKRESRARARTDWHHRGLLSLVAGLPLLALPSLLEPGEGENLLRGRGRTRPRRLSRRSTRRVQARAGLVAQEALRETPSRGSAPAARCSGNTCC